MGSYLSRTITPQLPLLGACREEKGERGVMEEAEEEEAAAGGEEGGGQVKDDVGWSKVSSSELSRIVSGVEELEEVSDEAE
jgi:hypothetical protein